MSQFRRERPAAMRWKLRGVQLRWLIGLVAVVAVVTGGALQRLEQREVSLSLYV